MGWERKQVAFRAVYGFLAPTGSFKAGAKNNVGSGYWTHAFSSGQTFYLTKNKATSLSAFQMYEIHSTQTGTNIHPGQTLDFDYSLMQTIPLRSGMHLQVGLVGYGQWQTTDKSGPTITAAQAKAHYKVNALGVGSNLNLPMKVNIGFKYFQGTWADDQPGSSLQASGSGGVDGLDSGAACPRQRTSEGGRGVGDDGEDPSNSGS